MRKIIVSSFITLDGIMQAPGGPDEDRSGGFEYGGWVEPYSDEEFGKAMGKQMEPSDLLLGRKTFDIFSEYWPEHAAQWPGINEATKYVLSKTVKESTWANTIFMDTVEAIDELKKSSGPDLKVWGSGEIVQLLLKNDLVDELWLKTFPIVLGRGKKLFDNSIIPTAFILNESIVSPGGVIIANYKKSGEVRTGTIGS